jgi:hypothetical protein
MRGMPCIRLRFAALLFRALADRRGMGACPAGGGWPIAPCRCCDAATSHRDGSFAQEYFAADSKDAFATCLSIPISPLRKNRPKRCGGDRHPAGEHSDKATGAGTQGENDESGKIRPVVRGD